MQITASLDLLHISLGGSFELLIKSTVGGLAMDIGLIGIGSMGAAMVLNLVKAEHQVSYPFQEATP